MRRVLGLMAAMVAAGAGTAEPSVAGDGVVTAKDGVFTSEAWGLRARYPAGVIVSDSFRPNFFDRGAWRVSYAADVGIGTPIVAFALPDLHASGAAGGDLAGGT